MTQPFLHPIARQTPGELPAKPNAEAQALWSEAERTQQKSSEQPTHYFYFHLTQGFKIIFPKHRPAFFVYNHSVLEIPYAPSTAILFCFIGSGVYRI
jgi:hypothetical protein